MFSILPFILILVALAIAAVIVVRKFPQLTLLDVDSIPGVQMEKKKEMIFKKRLRKQAETFGEKRKEMFAPLTQKLKKIQLSFRQYVGRVQKKALEESRKEREEKVPPADVARSLQILHQTADYALGQNDLDTAENKFIEMIKIDPKNKDAYFGLGAIYRKKGEKKEAEESFEFLLQLDPNHDGALMQLAEMAQENCDWERAIGYYERCLLVDDSKANRFVGLAELFLKIDNNDSALEAISQAVELEPQNPKYLDMLVEIGVKCGNKGLATDAYKQLRMVNPDNNKLAVLKDKIDNMPS